MANTTETHGEAAAAAEGAAQPADAGHATTATTEAGHGAEAHGAFPPFDLTTFPSQLLWLTIAFGLLYMLMSRVALPRVGKIIDDRNNRISGDLAEANRLKGESEAASAAYEQALAEARRNAAAIGQKARDEAKADADAERARAEAEVSAKVVQSEKAIAASKAKAMADVGGIAVDAAEGIVKSLVGGAVSKADIEKAVKAALTR
ncbi:MAG: F0F1 ATP synthase subunit B [Phyllobacteriaceae bacterium]|nr:F0F1 ATP synthase subunit B [Phyllobacteriaceae bacterium]